MQLDLSEAEKLALLSALSKTMEAPLPFIRDHHDVVTALLVEALKHPNPG